MAEQIHTPASFGGLMRYNDEYSSKFRIKATHVIVFIVLIILFVTVLKLFFPIGA